MPVMVNQNGLYVQVSDILLPNGNAHENVLDASGNEYFSKETFPVQLRMSPNYISARAAGSYKGNPVTKSAFVTHMDSITLVELLQYRGKQLRLSVRSGFSGNYYTGTVDDWIGHTDISVLGRDENSDKNVLLLSDRVYDPQKSGYSEYRYIDRNLNITIPDGFTSDYKLYITATAFPCVSATSNERYAYLTISDICITQ